MTITFRFGRFAKPIPFEKSDEEKVKAEIIELGSFGSGEHTVDTPIYLEDYPEGTEMVRADIIPWDEPKLQGQYAYVTWYNEDTGEEIFKMRLQWPNQNLNGGYMAFWIGHKHAGEGEIDRPGRYKVWLDASPVANATIHFRVESKHFAKEKHNRIYGTVTDKALGTPVAYATITFGSKTAITGNDGKYEIKDVWYSGEIVCQAPGYKPATKIIEAPEEGDLEVNFELERAEQPVTDVTPLVPPLQGIDAALKGYYESWQNFARNVLNIEEKDGVLTAGVGNPLGLIQQGFEKLKEALQDAIGEMPEQQKRSLQLKELLRLYTKGLLPKEVAEPQIIAIYEYFGLTEEDARKMMLSYFKSLTTSQIEGLFKKGLIDEAKAKEKLMRNEYTEEDAELIISLWKAEEEEKTKEEVKELNRSLLDRLFIADLISEDDYRNKLRELGYTDEDIDLLVNLAKTKKEVRVEEPKVLSKSDVLKAYREELIDEETAKKKLKELNYTDEDIELLLNMSAREKLGKLRVTSKPTRAMIIINDNPINLLTPETIELAPGNYSVTVSMEGYKTPEPKDVVIEEEGRTEVHFDLERMKIGYLTIRSRPSQAAIYINGVDTKLLTPQTFELEEGKYTITLKYRGYKDKEFEVEIKEGETIEKFLRLTRE
ncbi:MAG: hypothetical protein DRN68_06940 [Thaumarchaeota archaeon]|nr:MAG: hypothetical protein DRN68_06940 [Nitrososphaerota archaeon]